MNQELKQRIIGAIVVTALAAIFIPMLFDDPIENSGQSVSELAIPATPLNSDEISANKLPSNADQVLNAPNNESETLVNTEEENELSADNQLSQEIPANNDSTVNNADQRLEVQADSKNTSTTPSLDTGVVVETHKPSVSKKEQPELAKQQPTPEEPVWEEDKIIVPAATPAKTVKSAPIKATAKIKPTAPIKKVIPEKIVPEKVTITEKSIAVPTKPKAELSRWTIQVGSFNKKENATSLMETLRKENLPVTLDTIKGTNDLPIYRLKIGPALEKKRATEMKAKLDNLKIQSFLIAE